MLPVACLLPWRCTLLPAAQDGVALVAAHMEGSGSAAGAPAAAHGVPAIPALTAAKSAAAEKQEQVSERVSSAAPRAVGPPRVVRLADDVVMKAVGNAQPAFLRCWARAQRTEGLGAMKVLLHLEVDEDGKVVKIRSEADVDSPSLSRCLGLVARSLQFRAPGQPSAVDVPLMFRP